MPHIPAAYRRWLYLCTATALPILIAYDVVSESVAPLWANLAGALLGVSSAALAAANVTKDHDDDVPQ
jgi:hypothetical protein